METPQIDPSWVAHAKLAFASLCGGIARLYWRPASSIPSTVWLLFGCVTCGYYATPIVLKWWGLDESYSGGFGAAIGFIGMSIAEKALAAVDDVNLKDFLRSIFLRRAE